MFVVGGGDSDPISIWFLKVCSTHAIQKDLFYFKVLLLSFPRLNSVGMIQANNEFLVNKSQLEALLLIVLQHRPLPWTWHREFQTHLSVRIRL